MVIRKYYISLHHKTKTKTTMENLKFTKGEWTTRTRNSIIEVNAGKTAVADVPISYIEEAEANAKLIAASPLLIEALMELKKDIEADGYNYRLGTLEKVDNAINKATK